MRSKFKAVPVVFAALLVIGALTASPALAAPEWYSSTTPAWYLSGTQLSKSELTVWKGQVKLGDKAAGPLKQSTGVECEQNVEGTAETGVAGTVTKLTLSKCTVVEKGDCESLVSVEAVHLPWATELSYSKGALFDSVKSGGSGQPGYARKCRTALGEKTDTCTSATLQSSATNATKGVDAAFNDGHKEEIECTEGSPKKNGIVEGTQLIEAKSGTLEVGNDGTATKLASSLSVTAKGKIRLMDTKFLIGSEAGIECSIETEGTIEAAGKGKISGYHPSECKPEGVCDALDSIRTNSLPWGTELFTEGNIRDNIISGGTETPSWTIECEVNPLGKETFTCNVNTSLGMYNTLGGNIEEEFDPKSKKTSCTGAAEAGLWQGLLTIAHPESVSGISVK
jgi:hypothetical protein